MTPGATLSTSEAAAELNVSRQRVDQLYRKGRLKGPARAMRSPILLFRWAVVAEKSTRDGRLSPPASKGRQAADPYVQRLTAAVSELNARIEDLEQRQATAEASQRDSRSTNLSMNAVFDELRTALREDDEAIRLLVNALKRSRRAMTMALGREDERRA